MKCDKSIRLINDFRKLNSISVPLEYYFPRIDEVFLKLKGRKFFSKIDLEKGFYQLEIAEEDRHKTAFTTPFGKFQFNRAPFGLMNTPKFFNAMISEFLYNMDNVTVFIGNI